MTKGGYQIIDLLETVFTSGSGVTIAGIYDKIEGTRKQILISGFSISGIEQRDQFVNFSLSSTTFTATVVCYSGNHTLTISDDDVVTFTAAG